MNKLRKAFHKNGTIRKIVYLDGSRRFWREDGEEISLLDYATTIYDKWLLRCKTDGISRAMAVAPIISQAGYRSPGFYIGVDPASNDQSFNEVRRSYFSTTDHNISAIDAQIGTPVAVDIDTGLFIRARVADRSIGSIVGTEWSHRVGRPDVLILSIQTIGA